MQVGKGLKQVKEKAGTDNKNNQVKDKSMLRELKIRTLCLYF